MMRIRYPYALPALLLALLLVACREDEPKGGIKPIVERTVLTIDETGNVYNINGELITKLPDCEEVTQIITDGDDYFVSGVNSKMKVGYWKNGKWNTLHVDFIDDVEHWTFGIAKWDYNIYLLDPPNVLKNSGIFRLEDSEGFNPARHGISVSEGNCFVVGTHYHEVASFNFVETPILYYYHKGSYKKKVLPLPDGYTNGNATGICAFNANHYLVCGYVEQQAVLWDDNDQVQFLPRILDYPIDSESIYPVTMANAVEKLGEHVYVAGIERTEKDVFLATLWTDNVPQHLVYTNNLETLARSFVADIQGYYDDMYVVTQEYLTNSESYSVIWMNGKPIAKIDRLLISIAVH